MKNAFWKLSSTLVALSLAVVSFQNCSNNEFATISPTMGSSQLSANGNGTGYDGKVYASYGICGDGVRIKQQIQFSNFGASLTIDNCEVLPNPVQLSDSDITHLADDLNVLIYGNAVFDLAETRDVASRVTVAVCRTLTTPDPVTSFVYVKPDQKKILTSSNSSLLGYARTASGAATGAIAMRQNTSGSTVEYSSVSGALDLSLDKTTFQGRMSATFTSTNVTTVDAVRCFTQELPEY